MGQLATFFALGVLVIFADIAGADNPIQFGMKMSVRAYDAVCWYSTLKTFPKTNTNGYTLCWGKAEFQRKNIETDDFYKGNDKLKEEYFGKWMKQMVMPQLAEVYQKKCSDYLELKNSRAKAATVDGDPLNDGNSDYPYKAFSYCLMETLKDTYGEKALEAVKSERTHTRKHWMKTMLDRDNEFRKRHGADPLILSSDLNEAAQSWAQINADICNSTHAANENPVRQYKGGITGESIAAGQETSDEMDVSGYVASNGWYEEIKDYPYPNHVTGATDPRFNQVGHFTQSVWKNTKYVGYGMVINENCRKRGPGEMTRYVVARYYPSGNYPGEFPKNVGPPTD